MKYIPLIVVIGFFCIAGLIGSAIIKAFGKTQARYNCEIAEISPDFPIEARQKCRELRNENRTVQ